MAETDIGTMENILIFLEKNVRRQLALPFSINWNSKAKRRPVLMSARTRVSTLRSFILAHSHNLIVLSGRVSSQDVFKVKVIILFDSLMVKVDSARNKLD